MKKNLLELSAEILDLEAQLDNEDLTDQERQELVDAWLEAQGDATKKLDNYAAWIESLDTMADQRKYQAERMRRLAKADENRAERARERLKLYFERHKLDRFKTPRFTISLQQNGGTAPLIFPPSWEQDPELAPASFRKVVTELNKTAIRQAVEDFFKQAEMACAKAENDQDRRRLFKEWIERDESANRMYELIQGCSIGERGFGIRIR
jgi:hypothetical protein